MTRMIKTDIGVTAAPVAQLEVAYLLPDAWTVACAPGGDVDALADMTGLATELDEAIAQAVTGLRETGYSWAEIAARLGVSRQAAQQRWGHR